MGPRVVLLIVMPVTACKTDYFKHKVGWIMLLSLEPHIIVCLIMRKCILGA